MTMQTTINKNLLTYAVQTAIFCAKCQTILDVRDAVNVQLNERSVTCCGKCFDEGREKAYAYALSIGKTLDVLDGRELYPPTLREAKRMLAAMGMTLKYDRDVEEYNVNFKGGKEATRCYTPDLLDAIGTAKCMAAHVAKKEGK